MDRSYDTVFTTKEERDDYEEEGIRDIGNHDHCTNIILLLMDPFSNKFEFLLVENLDLSVALVGEILEQIPKCSQIYDTRGGMMDINKTLDTYFKKKRKNELRWLCYCNRRS